MNIQLLEEVIGIIADHLGISADDIAIDSDITGDLGADSLDIVELVVKFEKRFNMEITDEEIMQILTVEDIMKYITERLGEVQISDNSNPLQLSF
jgi:acyl carrier protein